MALGVPRATTECLLEVFRFVKPYQKAPLAVVLGIQYEFDIRR